MFRATVGLSEQTWSKLEKCTYRSNFSRCPYLQVNLNPVVQSKKTTLVNDENLIDPKTELVEVLMQLDEYRETFFGMICTVLQEFHHSVHESLKQLIQGQV